MSSILRTHLALLLALSMMAPLAGLGCAGGQNPDDEVVQQSVDDKIYDYRTVLRQLRNDPLAPEAGRELDLVAIWLGRAEQMRAAEEDEQMLELQLKAIEGQLVQVKSLYARRRAEKRLEQERASYEARLNKIQQLRQRNEVNLAPLEQEGQ
jgi:hypothetical protein